MKSNQVKELMNHKITIIVSFVFVFLIILITIGTSYSFKESELDLNGNGSVEVGDVIKLRKVIINDTKKYTLSFVSTGITFLNDQHVETIDGTKYKEYIIPDDNVSIISIECTNGLNFTYSNYTISIDNVNTSSTCTIYTSKNSTLNTINPNSSSASSDVNLSFDVNNLLKVASYNARSGSITSVDASNNVISVVGKSTTYQTGEEKTVYDSADATPANLTYESYRCNSGETLDSNNQCVYSISNSSCTCSFSSTISPNTNCTNNVGCYSGYTESNYYYTTNYGTSNSLSDACTSGAKAMGTSSGSFTITAHATCSGPGIGVSPQYSCTTGTLVNDTCYSCPTGGALNGTQCSTTMWVSRSYNVYDYIINYWTKNV